MEILIQMYPNIAAKGLKADIETTHYLHKITIQITADISPEILEDIKQLKNIFKGRNKKKTIKLGSYIQ